jgi:hypothetical protein
MTTQTLRGPGIVIHLDSNEIYPDDPGAGAPAIVETTNGDYTATYWCALDTGTLSGREGDKDLTLAQQEWLDAKFDEVDAFVAKGR